MNRFSRTATALALVASLLGGSLSVFAQTAQPQEPAKTQTETKQDPKKDQQEKAKPASNKALSPSEDPSMIGKRNINKGIIASMSGSTEKEVRLGRELAAQVDREAKFVDDPVITEYINRVGQNIVLHSDAKVAFTIKVIDSDEVNAFALPGGFFYVNKGLLLAADNEAELAGVDGA
jgi:predicted Zn-dependent protease